MKTANPHTFSELHTATKFNFKELPPAGGERSLIPSEIKTLIEHLDIECNERYQGEYVFNGYAPYTHFRPTEKGLMRIKEIIEFGAVIHHNNTWYELKAVIEPSYEKTVTGMYHPKWNISKNNFFA